jgi:Domain of unknown function (DUF3854)/Domain of unknown function (DUF927)
MSIPFSRGAGKWRRVSAESPCPICKGAAWCSISADGTVAKCQRVADGAFKTKTDKNGADYHLHRLGGAAPPPSAPPPPAFGPAPDRADANQLHRAYSALLTRLQMSEAHRDNLRGRGLTDDEIDRRGYRTLPIHGRAPLARALREQFGDSLLSVPGFVVKQGAGEKPYVTLAGAAGILVPVRDAAGRIVALLSRRDDARDGEGKYSYLSSTKFGGPSPGAPVHVPLGVAGPAEVVRVTEGALKSDLAYALSGLPTIGLPGVSTWRPALPMLRELGARTVRLAYDMDAQDKPTVARPLAALAEALPAEGFAVEMERWPAEHKGIDDALSAGAAVEVLTGDAARQAVADALTEATAGEPVPEPGPLGRLAEVLADGGAEALYRNGELLRALAQLAESDPAEFACRRAQLQRAGVKLRDLDKALAPLRQELRRRQPPPDAADCYRIVGGRIVRDVLTKDGPVETPLANWSGRIVEETVRDDGAERRIVLAVEGALANGTPLSRADVPADQFPFMRWPVEAWGTRAVVLAGASTADHLRAALQLLSRDVPRRIVYAHTGWRKIGEDWFYLHGDGAIGAEGRSEAVETALPEALAGFQLPDPPDGPALAEAIRASLRILDGLAPDRIAFPLLAAVYRAVLGPADFALHLAGPTGCFKTEAAALAQQHCGAGMDARNLPGSWSSTGNSLETVAFAAKDALFVVDDFAPSGSTADVQRFHREADRLLRAQGNRSGRGRCKIDGSPRAAKPPRGLILSTGEDVPRGQSLRSRMFVVEISPGDVRVDRLTQCQTDAAAGLYAQALAGFVRWLAPRYEELHGQLRREAADLRDKARAEGRHARTPGIVADLALGLKYFLAFAVEIGAVAAAERDDLARRCWAALGEAAAAQARHVEAAEPCGQFLRLLAGVIASGRGYVAGPDGDAPAEAERWGWRNKAVGGDSRQEPQGRCVGWVEDDNLYLEPEACFAEAQDLARVQGDSLPVGSRTLYRRLKEKGWLASWDEKRQRNTIRRTLEGVKDREVIHLHTSALSHSEPSEPSANPPEPHETGEKRTVHADSTADSNGVSGGRPSAKPSAKPAENAVGGRFGRSDTGVKTHTPEIITPPRKRRRGAI